MSAAKTKRVPGTMRALYRRAQRIWSDYGERLPQCLRKPVLRALSESHALFTQNRRGITVSEIRVGDSYGDADDVKDIWDVVKEAEEVLGL